MTLCRAKTVSCQFVMLVCILALMPATNTEGPTEQEMFDRLNAEHKEVCPIYDTCGEAPLMGNLPHFCCSVCSCEPDCLKHGTCCLDYFHSFTEGISVIANNRYECTHLQYISSGSEFNTKDTAWLVSKCLPEAKETWNAYLCENPGTNDFLQSIVPVTELATGTNYRNKFCAFCNGATTLTGLVSWQLEIYNKIIFSITDENLLPQMRANLGNIFYRPPSYINVDDCRFSNMYTVSKCNVTGLWAVYDKFVEIACNAFSDPFNKTFQNYFCYVCNSPPLPADHNITAWECTADLENIIKDVSPPFFAILDVSDVEGETKEASLECLSSQFTDLKKMLCRDIQCQENREMINGQCEVLSDGVNLFSKDCLSTSLKLTPKNLNLTLNHISYIRNEKQIYGMLSKKIKGFENRASKIQLFGVSGIKVEFEHLLVHFEVNMFNFSKADKLNKILKSVIEMDESIVVMELSEGEVGTPFAVNIDKYDILQANVDLIDKVNEPFFLYEAIYDNAKCSSTQALSRLTLCPFIVVNITEVTMELNKGLLFINGGWENRSLDVVLSQWAYEIHSDELHVCLDTFTEIYNRIPGPFQELNTGSNDFVEAKQILSLICVCLSVLCLLVTIFTYLKFSVLQSQPGINTITLCLSLLFAQTLYQFGAGQRSLTKWSCALIGAFCHFLWLAVMFSMNICSIHMFTIFKTHKQMSPRFVMKTTIKNICYIVGCSLLFVIVNVIISLSVRNDTLGGYGGHVCFISSNIMQIITFIVPMGVIIATNLFLFSYVVLRLSKMSATSIRLNQERNYFHIYVRLSTLTGLTWLFGFLQLFLDVDIFEYIFIVLNSGQGVFIMIAFVLNKRIYSLYAPKSKVKISEETGAYAVTN